MDHVDKFYWIIDHPKIGCEFAQGVIELTPHRVNPLTNSIDEDVSLNTKYVWWIEFSKLDKENDEFNTHYWELDCGGGTAEEAIHNLYTLVLEKYGEY